MTKKLDWDSLATPHGSRPLPGAPQAKAISMKDKMAKAHSEMQHEISRQEFMRKAEPGMLAIFNYHMMHKQPIEVVRPLAYKTTALEKSERGAKFVETTEVLPPGVVLIPAAIDPSMQEYVFKAQNGEDVAISFSEVRNILFNTDIFEFVSKHLTGE